MTLEKSGPTASATPSTRWGRPMAPSGDPIDRVVKLAPTWTVFALIACAILVIGIVVWAITGTVSSTVTSPGILHDVGASTVRASSQSQVDQLPAHLGDMVTKGQTVATLRDGTTLVAPVDGQVVSVAVSPGSPVVPGQDVVIVADLTVDPVIVTKIAPSYISTIRVGMPVRMEVVGAPASKDGYLLGTVSDITNNPFTNAQIATRLGLDAQVVASELGDEPGLLAVVRPIPDRSTPTGFKWSVGQGPSILAQQGVVITVHTVLKETSPLGMVFPQFASR